MYVGLLMLPNELLISALSVLPSTRVNFATRLVIDPRHLVVRSTTNLDNLSSKCLRAERDRVVESGRIRC